MLFNILSHNIFNKILMKLIYILTIIIFFSVIFLGIMPIPVQAAQYTEKYKTGNLKDYPGYETLLENLKKEHPNWTFTILYTELDWNTVIKNETTSVHGRNLIDGSKTGAWVCPTCADNKYDNGNWKCASEATVAYYMDPRNSLYEDYIFQFENLRWVDDLYTIEGINKILSDCKYLQGSEITYKGTDGKEKTINKSYAQVIFEAAQENKVSPYHLAARIRQEQGPGNEASSTATGNYKDYIGYYNFFNVKASGSGSDTIIRNALKYAKEQKWTDPEKAIKGGAEFIVKEYIEQGQNTLYLQKFDVDSSDGDLYWHQYMQNVSAAKTEGNELLTTYSNMMNEAFNFIIPVYEKMPTTKCPQPASQMIVTQNIEITDEEIVVRKSKSETSEEIGTLKKGDKVLRIEIGNTKTNGNLWDKVVLSNGKKGYIVSNKGFNVLDDIADYDIKATAIEEGNVRNGPGTSGTTIITTLSMGQMVTIIEKGKYNDLDGYNWSRIYLSDGRQGYIVSEYLEEITNEPPKEENNPGNTTKKEIVEVITSSGLSIREKPGTDAKILKYAEKGDYLTRIDKEVSTKNGYIWDQVVTDEGIEGYVARGDKDGDYIRVVENVETAKIEGKGFKTSGTNIICEPQITVEDIKKVVKEAIIKNKSGKEVTSGNIGTNYTIKYNGQTYTVVKLGDINSDGKINSGDTLIIQQHIVKIKEIKDKNYIKAADLNNDGKINSGDTLIIQQHIVKIKNITL